MENLTTVDEFNELNHEYSSTHTLLDFYADWCGPCQPMKKMLEELEDDYPDIEFYKVNTEHATDMALQFGIRSIPTLVMLRPIHKDPETPNTLIGLQSKEDLIKFLDNI